MEKCKTFKDIVVMLAKSKHVKIGSRVLGTNTIVWRDERLKKQGIVSSIEILDKISD
jgi:hypothetical protein